MSFNLDGTGDYFTTASMPVTAYPFTMCAWVNPDAISNTENILWLGDNGVDTQYARLDWNSTGAIRVGSNAGSGVNNILTTTTTTTGVWAHACGVWNSATDRRGFLNGGGKITGATSRNFPTNGDQLAIGMHRGSTPTGDTDARIAHVAIWNVALSDAEILALASGISPLMIRPANLVGYWPGYDSAWLADMNPSGTKRPLTANGNPTTGANPPVFTNFVFDEDIHLFIPAGAQTKDLTPADETDAAQALDIDKAVTLGVSSETDTAQALDVDKALSITLATETDAAQALDVDKAVTLGIASETDVAITLSITHIIYVTLTLASETDAAQALDVDKSLTITQASETDAAQAIDVDKAVTIGTGSETDSAQALSFFKSLVITTATEADSARALDVDKSLSITLAGETDSAIALDADKAVTISLASEADSAQAFDVDKYLSLVLAGETDAAQALAPVKSFTIVVANETDTAIALDFEGGGDFGLVLDPAETATLTLDVAADGSLTLSVAPEGSETLSGASEDGLELIPEDPPMRGEDLTIL